MASDTLMNVELDLMSDTIDAELEFFKEELLEYPTMNNIRYNQEFQDYLDAQLKMVSARIKSEYYNRKQSYEPTNLSVNKELEKTRCVIRLQNISMKIHSIQSPNSNDNNN